MTAPASNFQLPASKRTALGVVVSQFPEMHETFVVREVAALRDGGIPLRIYSLKRCRDRIVHPEAQALLGQAACLAWDDPLVWMAGFGELAAHPLRGLAGLGWALRHHAWPPVTLAKALVVWVQALALARRMRRDGITHIHAHWATMPTTAAVIISRRLSIPFSFTAHAWDIFVRNPSLTAKIQLAERVITCTEYNRSHLAARCPEAAGKILLNYHGVDVATFQRAGGEGRGTLEARSWKLEARESSAPFPVSSFQFPASDTRPLLLSVGRLVETKGYGILLEAYARLKAKGIAFRAVIVGQGPLRQALQRRLAALGLSDAVELRPAMSRDELRALYGQAFAFVLPSVVAPSGDRDGIPNVVLEAMAMGLPVVSTTVSGIPEAVQDRRTGLLVPPGDPNALARAVEVLLRRPRYAAVMGDQGRMWAETQFSGHQHMQRLVVQMRELLMEARSWKPEAGTSPEGVPTSSFQLPASRRPIRVMYIIWSLEVGGAERVVTSLAKGLDRTRFAPRVVCLNQPGALAAELAEAGIPVEALHKRPGLDLVALWRLVRLMRRERPGVVHTHLWGGNCWGRVAARLARVPVIVATEHSVDTWKRWHHFMIDRWLARLTTHLVAVSNQARDFYEARRVGAGRWQVIYNGVGLAKFQESSQCGVRNSEFGMGHSALRTPHSEFVPVVGFIGRLVQAKAPAVFVGAVAEARRRLPSLKALIVGDGPLRQDLEAQVRRLGLEHAVVFTGVRRDVSDLLAGMDALVFSSEREGLSMAMLEAMAAGVPVVATRVGGTPELIEDGVTGLLVESGNPLAVAERIVELLQDPARARAIAETARRCVHERFSLKRMVEQHEAVYVEAGSWKLETGKGAEDPPASSFQFLASKRAAKVVYIIDDLGLGGAQRQLVELVQTLPRERYEPHIISLSTSKLAYAPAVRDLGVPLSLIPQSRIWSCRALWTLYRTLRRLRPQIVHTGLFTADLYGRLAARAAGVPVVVSTVHSVELDKPWHYVAVDRWLKWLTDWFVVTARAVRTVLHAREGVSGQRTTLIYNGVDPTQFAPHAWNGALRRRIGVSSERPLIGIIGRLAPVKDHETFLRAAALVREAVPESAFVIVGDGQLKAALQSLAQRLGLSASVSFLESQGQIAPVYDALDALVVSSQYEGCCRVILEAMAMGKPVVATDSGGTPELVVDGETGRLVPPSDPDRLAEAIVGIIRDPDMARAMGLRGRRRVEEQFSLERMVAQTDSLYRALCRRKGVEASG